MTSLAIKEFHVSVIELRDGISDQQVGACLAAQVLRVELLVPTVLPAPLVQDFFLPRQSASSVRPLPTLQEVPLLAAAPVSPNTSGTQTLETANAIGRWGSWVGLSVCALIARPFPIPPKLWFLTLVPAKRDTDGTLFL